MNVAEKIYCFVPILGVDRVNAAIKVVGPAGDWPCDSETLDAHDKVAGRFAGGTKGRLLHTAIVSIVATPVGDLIERQESINAAKTLVWLASIGYVYGVGDSERIDVAEFAAAVA